MKKEVVVVVVPIDTEEERKNIKIPVAAKSVFDFCFSFFSLTQGEKKSS
jgi:hypothetical protein